jgi:hypothetical protein
MFGTDFWICQKPISLLFQIQMIRGSPRWSLHDRRRTAWACRTI